MDLINQFNIFSIFFLVLYWILIFNILKKIFLKRKIISIPIAWILFIYVLPILGILLYLLLGECNLDKIRIKRSKILYPLILKRIKKLKKYDYIFNNKNSKVAKPTFKLCKNFWGIDGMKSDTAKILTKTDKIFKTLIKDINLAKNNIKMIFYIWKSGGLINQVIAALIAAANRGVNCMLILDSAGSMSFLRSRYPMILKRAGINLIEALRLNALHLFLRRMDLRQHRKIILIDNYISYTGSMNMVDSKLFKKNLGIGEWKDIMVRIEGPIAIIMNNIFSLDWEIETGERILPILRKERFNCVKKIPNHSVQIIASGPTFNEGIISQILLTSIYSARKKIVITTPYLIPSEELLNSICTAARRGVKVLIVIPLRNDSILANWASKSFFLELLEAGVIIYQFKNGLLHAKSILIDDKLSLIGTINLDIRSLYINFEITLIIDDTKFGNNLANIQKNYINCSEMVSINQWINRPYWKKIIEKIVYFLNPLL